MTKYRESKAPTAESIHAIDYSRRLELIESACKIFAIPMEVRHVWSRIRFFSWFRATFIRGYEGADEEALKRISIVPS